MPVNEKYSSRIEISQREQYLKGGIGKKYWDYRDKVALSLIEDKDESILDCGCGEGITLNSIIRRSPESQVAGIDIMAENVDICRQFGLPVSQGNVYSIRKESESLDVVVLMEVIEHLEYPERAIKEIHRVLKPGGKLIFVFPNDGIFKVARILTLKLKEAFYDPGHVKQWTHREVNELLIDAGFEIFYSRSIPFGLWIFSLHGVVGAIRQ